MAQNTNCLNALYKNKIILDNDNAFWDVRPSPLEANIP